MYFPSNHLKALSKDELGPGFVSAQEFGLEFVDSTGENMAKKPVRLLFNGNNHYDLLV